MRRVVDGEICAGAFANDIECFAEMNLDGLVAGRVVDEIFADEFECSVGVVHLIDAHLACGQRHAERVVFLVFEAHEN